MNNKTLYGIIAIIVVIILIVSIIAIVQPQKSSAPTLSITSSTTFTTVGQSISFIAFTSSGVSTNSVLINFGDGSTATANYSSSASGYISSHTYTVPGKYLVTAYATINGVKVNNLASILAITVTSNTVSPALASEITEPVIICSSQIFTNTTVVNMSASSLQPPTATNWTIGYYIWNFGNGATRTDYAVLNNTSGSFMPDNISYTYPAAGTYAITLSVITFNATNYASSNYTLNGNSYLYYPISDLSTVLSSGLYQNNSYEYTILIVPAGTVAKLSKSVAANTNANEIINAELVPGGPYSFDPDIDYEMVGGEVILNVYETLLAYNGSSVNVSNIFPMVASKIPTVANGGISSNYLNYTFYIRSGLKFSNGDPLTAWDVYVSYVRALLFVQGSPGTPGWVIASDLLPGGGFANNATSYQNITHAITYSNQSQSITFHLMQPNPAFLEYLSDLYYSAILDWNWLVAHGAGIAFNAAGFANYTQYGNEVDYNTYIQYNAMGSGPYKILDYVMGQSITLVPNSYYTPIPGIPGYNHKANDTIQIEWIKDPETELLMLKGGLADIYYGLPNYYYSTIAREEAMGNIKIYSFPTMSLYCFTINPDIDESLLSTLGSNFHIPQYYFANLDVRRAFADSFNYQVYLNNLVGNKEYGANFSSGYVGFIPKGMPGYQTPQQMAAAGVVLPTYNLTLAKHYLEESGEYNISINIPAIVYAGDPVDFSAAAMWGQALKSIDPNIVMTPMYMTFSEIMGYDVPFEDPTPIAMSGFVPDYPFPSDYIQPWQINGTNVSMIGLDYSILNYNQTSQVLQMEQDVASAQSCQNITESLKYYDAAEDVVVNLTAFVYTQQVNWFWYYSPSLKGVQYEEGPILGGAGATLYIYLSK
ncbi:MAG: ABC transporter substrate-binding protein [Thermoplasmata archaeon]